MCPHCGTTANHGARICCCSGCGVLFTSGSAFDKHYRDLACLPPEDAGLVRKAVGSDPGAVAWGLPAGDAWWSK